MSDLGEVVSSFQFQHPNAFTKTEVISFPGATLWSMFFQPHWIIQTIENRTGLVTECFKANRSLRVATLLETHAISHHRLGCSSPMATGRSEFIYKVDRDVYIRMYVHTYVRTYIRMYVHTYVRTYVRMYVNWFDLTYLRSKSQTFSSFAFWLLEHLTWLG